MVDSVSHPKKLCERYNRKFVSNYECQISVGNFSSLSFSFKLAREMGYYVMDYYIPSMMIVAISWVSFWLQADQSAPRITLGDLAFLS